MAHKILSHVCKATLSAGKAAQTRLVEATARIQNELEDIATPFENASAIIDLLLEIFLAFIEKILEDKFNDEPPTPMPPPDAKTKK